MSSVAIPNPSVLSPHLGLTDTQLRASPVSIQIAQASGQVDGGSRLRVSQPEEVFESTQEYDEHPLIWEHVTAGSGTATYTQALNSTVLSTAGTASGDRAFRGTKVYWRYIPGKAQAITMTGVLAYSGTPSGAAVARIGYFSDNNGVFFGRDATGYFVAIRSNTSGSVAETKVYQSSWDDPMDGTGDSGVTIDFTKSNIFTIDFLWLGSGQVRFGFKYDSLRVTAHSIINESQHSGPYMRTANLPLRYEVFNSGGTGANISMLATCACIESEGGLPEEPGLRFRAGTAGSTVSCANTAALTPLFSIRLVDTFKSLTYRGHVHPLALHFLNTSTNPGYFQVLWNTSLTGATFANSADSTHSGVEYDTAATAVSGGVIIGSGYIAASGVGMGAVPETSATFQSKMILARTYANTRDIITIAARGIGGAATIASTLEFLEQR